MLEDLKYFSETKVFICLISFQGRMKIPISSCAGDPEIQACKENLNQYSTGFILVHWTQGEMPCLLIHLLGGKNNKSH